MENNDIWMIIAREIPTVAAFFLLIVFVLKWIATIINKRDEQWQEFLQNIEEGRGEREEQWRSFLEGQQQASAALTREHRDQMVNSLKEVAKNLEQLAREHDLFRSSLEVHDRKVDVAIAELKIHFKK